MSEVVLTIWQAFELDDFKFEFQILKTSGIWTLKNLFQAYLDFINNSECDEDILIYWGQKA